MKQKVQELEFLSSTSKEEAEKYKQEAKIHESKIFAMRREIDQHKNETKFKQ